jgi:hypothetical protein
MPREPIGFSLWNARYNGLFPKNTRVVNRCSFAMGNVSSRALEEESPVCLASRHSHWFRLYLLLNYLSTFLHPFAPRALPRFFALTGALTPAQWALRTLTRGNEHPPYPRQVSLVHTARPSMHSVTTHLTRPAIASPLPAQRDRLPGLCPGLDFALNPQARRYARPNRVRHYPTDCMFVSGCSPPRVAATQLPLTTRKRASSGEGTFAPQIAPAPRRADSGFRRNDDKEPCLSPVRLSGESRSPVRAFQKERSSNQ